MKKLVRGKLVVFGVVAVLAAAVLGMVSATHGSAQPAADRVSLRLGWSYGGPFAPIYLGVQKGFFAKQGIDLQIAEGKGTVVSAGTVASGKDQFGYFDMGAAARLIDKGVPLIGIAQIRQRTTMSVISLAKNNITKYTDLYGKTLSHTPGDSLSQVWPAVAAAAHLDDSQIHQEGLDYSVYLKALANGQVDAIMGYQDWEGFTLQNQGLKINMIPFTKSGITLVDYGFVTSTSLAKKNPDLVRRFVAAASESFAYAKTHVDEAVAAGKKKFPEFSAKLARKQVAFQSTLFGSSVAKGKPIGWIDRSVWVKSLAVLKKYMGVKNTNPSKYYTNQFLSP
jgi:NitT/TauT family transport system substrate-binding protein